MGKKQRVRANFTVKLYGLKKDHQSIRISGRGGKDVLSGRVGGKRIDWEQKSNNGRLIGGDGFKPY